MKLPAKLHVLTSLSRVFVFIFFYVISFATVGFCENSPPLAILAPVNLSPPDFFKKSHHDFKTRVDFYTHGHELQQRLKNEPRRWDIILAFEDQLEVRNEKSNLVTPLQETFELYDDPIVIFWKGFKDALRPEEVTWNLFSKMHLFPQWRQKVLIGVNDTTMGILAQLASPKNPDQWLYEVKRQLPTSKMPIPALMLMHQTFIGVHFQSLLEIRNNMNIDISMAVPKEGTYYRTFVAAILPTSSQIPVAKSFFSNLQKHSNKFQRSIWRKSFTRDSSWKKWPISSSELWPLGKATTKKSEILLRGF